MTYEVEFCEYYDEKIGCLIVKRSCINFEACQKLWREKHEKEP